MGIEVITNNIPRLLEDGFNLSAEEIKEFDYVEDIAELVVVRYKGELYDIGEFMRPPEELSSLGWHGYSPDTYFSGVVVKLLEEDQDRVVVGTYFVKSGTEAA